MNIKKSQRKLNGSLLMACLALMMLLCFTPSNVKAEKLRTNEVGTNWKRSGNYSFKLTGKGKLYCKDQKGKKKLIAKNVDVSFCDNGIVIYRCVTPGVEIEDLMTYYCYEPASSRCEKYSLGIAIGPPSPEFYYKGHLMLHADADYGSLICINTSGDVKNWKTIPLVEEFEGYSWSFRRVGDLFYYNDRYFMDADKTSVGIFDMKNDKVSVIKNAWSASIINNKLYYVAVKMKRGKLPKQDMKFYSCQRDGTQKKLIRTVRLDIKADMLDFDVYADSKNVYWSCEDKYFRLNCKTGKRTKIKGKLYNSRREKLRVIG